MATKQVSMTSLRDNREYIFSEYNDLNLEYKLDHQEIQQLQR